MNKISGKNYIGQSIDIKHRWKDHIFLLKNGTAHNAHLQNAWNKYGEYNFLFEVIDVCSVEMLVDREDYWINFYHTKNKLFGYNKKDAGAHGRCTEETKAKMSCSQAKEKNPMYGKHHTKEAINKISEANRNREEIADASREKMKLAQGWKNNPRFGKKVSSASSKFFGIFFSEKHNRWYCRFRLKGKSNRCYVGSYVYEIDAAIAYDKYIIENKIDRPLNFKKETDYES